MKKKVVIGGAVLLFIGCAWWANSDAGKEFVRKDKEKQAAEEKAHPEPLDTKARLINTVWESPEIGYNKYPTGPNLIVLSFYADSVTFIIPSGNSADAFWYLGAASSGRKPHYSWEYTVKGNRITLDPGLTGFDVPVELVGDSLAWKGDRESRFDHFAFKRVR